MTRDLPNTYDVFFDFTTVHAKGRLVGRNGQINISTDAPPEDVCRDLQTIQRMCADAIHAEKPKWNILMINIKDIKLLNSEP